MKQTQILNLEQYDPDTDSNVKVSEYITDMSNNMEIIDKNLGPFKNMNLYIDEDGDICQNIS